MKNYFQITQEKSVETLIAGLEERQWPIPETGFDEGGYAIATCPKCQRTIKARGFIKHWKYFDHDIDQPNVSPTGYSPIKDKTSWATRADESRKRIMEKLNGGIKYGQ